MMMIRHEDCFDTLSTMDRVSTIIADPPDNIGYSYEGFRDHFTHYDQWMELLIRKCLEKCDTLWLTYNAKWMNMVGKIVSNLKTAYKSRTIIWRYTFGQYIDTDFASGYRPILLMRGPLSQLDFDSIRIPSARMLSGDSRAAGPRVPDDVWEYPRVVGNYHERRHWHTTQLPEAMVERIVKCSGGPVYDPFLGSGTTGIVCNRLGVKWSGSEISDYYVEKLNEIFSACK